MPLQVFLVCRDFRRCNQSGRVYWRGSHFDQLEQVVEQARSLASPPTDEDGQSVLGLVSIVRSIVGRSKNIEHAIDAVSAMMLDPDQALIGILEKRERRLYVTERCLCVEDLHHGVILDAGEQAGDILVCGRVHAITLARDCTGRNQGFYPLVHEQRAPEYGYNQAWIDNYGQRSADMLKKSWALIASMAFALIPATALTGEGESLKGIMQTLRQNFLDVSDGFLLDDFDKVADGALAIAEHPRIPAEQVQRVADELGPEMPVFKNFDVQVHELSLELYKAAQDGDRVAALAAYQGMFAACIDCHAAFRQRVAAVLGESGCDSPEAPGCD